MKSKERSPGKSKRSRGAEDLRDRGSSKKTTSASSSGKSDGGSGRRSSASRSAERRTENREYDGGHHSSRNHNYGGGGSSGASSSKASGGLSPESRHNARPSTTSSSTGRSSTERGSSGDAQYKTLKISELGSQLSDEAIEDGLFHEFKKFGDVSVKISRTGDERVAFVNFRRPEDARAAKHARGRLVLYDRTLKIEAVYAPTPRRRSRSPLTASVNTPVAADKEPFNAGSTTPLSGHRYGQRAVSPNAIGYRDYRLQQLALGRLPPPPPPPLPRELERDREFGFYENRLRPAGYNLDRAPPYREEEISPEDDQRANRTLFLGNLDPTTTEQDLRRAFERFGVITEIDIKRPTRGQSSTYGFVKFQNLDMAHRAKVAMSGKPICRNIVKIGYGKATPTTRLWVGGLGPWVPLAALAREFDRFGTIRTIDYRKGDTWAYIQYESLDAAQAACAHMRGFPMGGSDRRLRVDFAETENRYQQQYLQPLPLPHYDLIADSFGHRGLEPLRPPRDRTPPPFFRDRELYLENDWAVPAAVRDRNRPGFDLLDHVDRERRRETWSAERDREREALLRDLNRKRRAPEDSRHGDRSPGSDRSRKRHCMSADRSPGGSSGRDVGRFSDTERTSRNERPVSPSRVDGRNSIERGTGDRRDRKSSLERDTDRKRRTNDNKSPAKKEERPENTVQVTVPTPSKVTPKVEIAPKPNLAWQGMLLLKNSNFPTHMHLLQGDMAVASGLLVDGSTGGKVDQLKITQRLRLDQPKLDEVNRRIKAAGAHGYAVLLAVPGTADTSSATEPGSASTQRPLRNLVSYLKQKQAAGVISLPVGGNKDKENTGVLHAFPPCDFSQQFFDSSAKALAKSEEDYLVMIIVRGAS
ncbi:RNA-binding protein 15 [Protopterus annectens]|uniref:RNA-binding protein 15 n=1 Tax=Protopterus annectens TaxID=7888 RepID=UPI001CF93311|nr:RNA-binding protein 15 [Protopterus annectens]